MLSSNSALSATRASKNSVGALGLKSQSPCDPAPGASRFNHLRTRLSLSWAVLPNTRASPKNPDSESARPTGVSTSFPADVVTAASAAIGETTASVC
jgi:hypothetical protein